MGLIITSIILTILTMIGILGFCMENDYSKKYCLIGLVWLSIILFGCFSNVGANKVGVLYNPLKGGIQDEILGEGFRMKSPLEKVYKISTEVQEFTFENISFNSYFQINHKLLFKYVNNLIIIILTYF